MPCLFLDRGEGEVLLQGGNLQSCDFEGVDYIARRCTECGHVFFDPPDFDLLKRYYNDIYPAASASWYNIDIDYSETKVKFRSELILQIAERYGFDRSHHYHEIGCAFGGTISELNRRGYNATGTEFNEGAVEQARGRGNMSVSAGSDIAFFERTTIRPNVVFGFHVLEHFGDPLAYLRDLSRLLADNAIVILLVPNAMALFPSAYGFNRYDWFGYPGHLHMFSPHSAMCAARAAGFEVLEMSSVGADLQSHAKAAISGPLLQTPITTELQQQMINAGLFGEELVFVVSPSRSPVSMAFAKSIIVASSRCEANRRAEQVVREIGATEPVIEEVPTGAPAPLPLVDQRQLYTQWSVDTFGTEVPVPGVLFATSFPPGSIWGDKAHNSLLQIEMEYVDELLTSIRDHGVEGSIAEFGVFEGWWLRHLFEATEKLGLHRPILGFDSFKGYSAPHPEFDGTFWQEGMYSVPRHVVEDKIGASQRPRIRLFEGFFADSLLTEETLTVGPIAFARIDCDIYEPAGQCLSYLSERLSHGSVLVLDDWPHQLDIGEGRAFAEWVPTVPHLRFEFLFLGTWGHLYIRVWHRNLPAFVELPAKEDSPAPAPGPRASGRRSGRRFMRLLSIGSFAGRMAGR